MNKSLLMLLEGFWQNIGEFFKGFVDIIPKIVYVLFTAFSSGIDAMQALVRKLAGLDVYYSANTSEAFYQVDPLTEFIFGILGIGKSSATYKALNTVFWSLTIFALIMLVLCTMVAMIKSHYSEDTQGTSPWKYIYTAIKAVLTWAVIPVVMVLGLQISSFILRTLDNITTTSSGAEQIRTIYGSKGTDIFVGSKMEGTDEKSYIYYDYFGVGDPTNNTPFGSFLFKAAAYNANRVRSGDSSIGEAQSITVNGNQVFGDSSCQAYSSLTSNADKAEYIAYQIDYAFCNNLHLNSSISIDTLDAAFPDVTFSKVSSGMFSFKSLNSFTKYNVNGVWFFYNLWQFNFIVAFGGGVTIFGVLLSVIIGLMTRLVKGAALFLIYPALLGIAPLDNFKAFKGWASTLLQQILMAFGAIVGMNVLLLLLPYLQNIAFFGQGVIDAIISMILLIVGLLMTKDFISMVAGFAGGGDANSIGSGMKSDIAGTVKKGASLPGKMAGGAVTAGVAVAKGTIAVGKGIGKGAGKIGKAISHDKKAKAINKMNKDAPLSTYGKDTPLASTIKDSLKAAKTGKMEGMANEKAAKAAAEAMRQAKSEGKTKDLVEAAGIKAARETLAGAKRSAERKEYNKMAKADKKFEKKVFDKDTLKERKQYRRASKLREKVLTGDLKLDRNKDNTGYSRTHTARLVGKAAVTPFFAIGKGVKEGFVGIGKKIAKEFNEVSIGKSMAKAFTTSVGALGEAMGADKLIGGAKDIFKGSFSMVKKKSEDKLEGDKLSADIGKKQREATEKQTAVLKQILDAQKDLKQAQSKNTDELKKFTSRQSTNTSSNNNNSNS